MKRVNKRTFVWGMLTAGVLSTAAFSDNYTFGDKDSVKTTSLQVQDKQKKAFKLLSTEEDRKYTSVTAGVGNMNFVIKPQEEATPQSVLLNQENVVDGTVSMESNNVPMVTAAFESAWAHKAIVTTENEVEVKREQSQESELAGKLHKGDEMEVSQRGDEWSLITSGNLTGYVRNEALEFGDAAEELSEQLGDKVATVQTETLNVRRQPAEEAGIYEQAAKGKEYIYSSCENGWTAVTLDSGETGYVKQEYVTMWLRLGHGITVEEEQAAAKAEQERIAREQAEKKAAEEAAAKKKAEKKAKQAEAVKTQQAATTASVDDTTLLAAIIELEAGGNYEGGIAVGNVVLNRVNSPSYPNSISGVIYQKGQFPGAHNGKLARILARGPHDTARRAAQAALNGENLVGSRLYFNSQRSINYNKVSNYVLIGGNCFY